MTGINHTIDVTDLQRGLTAQWDAMSDASDLPLHRSSTINLIASTRAEHLAELRDEIANFVVRYPCRAFLLAFDSTTELRAEYDVDAVHDRSSRRVVCERLTFHARPPDHARLSSLIRPRLLGELPVLFYAHGPMLEDVTPLRALAAECDLFVFDSSALARPERQIAELAAIAHPARDLNWFRLAPWRRALALALEKFEWRRDVPTRAEIHHGIDGCATAASVVLGDWLALKLDAQITRATDAAGDAPHREPSRVVLTHGANHVDIARCCERPRLRTTVTLEDHCLIPFESPASRGTRGALLAAAADRI